MKTDKLLMIGLFLLTLGACSSDKVSESLPEFPTDAENCAADGPNCKQYNPNL